MQAFKKFKIQYSLLGLHDFVVSLFVGITPTIAYKWSHRLAYFSIITLSFLYIWCFCIVTRRVSIFIVELSIQCVNNSNSVRHFYQGIIDMNRNGNSANFFLLYVRNKKKSKELFASFLNGILISVICVSSIKLVFNAQFDQLLAAHSNEKSVRAEETRISCVFCWLKHIDVQLLSQSLLCTRKTSLFFTFQRSIKLIEIIRLC